MNSVPQHLLIRDASEIDLFIKSRRQSVVLVYASWCPFCLQFLPVFQKYAAGKDHFLLAQDDQELLADRYGIEIIPTVLCFANGTVVARLDGVAGIGLNERQLVAFLKGL